MPQPLRQAGESLAVNRCVLRANWKASRVVTRESVFQNSGRQASKERDADLAPSKEAEQALTRATPVSAALV